MKKFVLSSSKDFLVNFLASAGERIKIAVFKFSSPFLLRLAANKASAGINVHIITCPPDMLEEAADISYLEEDYRIMLEAGARIDFCRLQFVKPGAEKEKILERRFWYSFHPKFIICDNKLVVTSANLDDENFLESFLMTDDPYAVKESEKLFSVVLKLIRCPHPIPLPEGEEIPDCSLSRRVKVPQTFSLFENIGFCHSERRVPARRGGRESKIGQPVVHTPRMGDVVHVPRTGEGEEKHSVFFLSPITEKARSSVSNFINASHSSLYIACRYYYDEDIHKILLGKLENKNFKLKLITSPPLSSRLYRGKTEKFLKQLKDRGAEVRTFEKLHGRLFLSDSSFITGSVNLASTNLGYETQGGWNSTIESLFKSSHPALLKQAESEFLNLWKSIESGISLLSAYSSSPVHRRSLDSILNGITGKGIKVDETALKDEIKKLEKETESELKEIRETSGDRDFNPNSHLQVGILLFEKMKIPGYTRILSGYDVSDSALNAISHLHSLPSKILKLRKKGSLLVQARHIMENIQAGTRIHPRFRKDTATGRIVAFSPALQSLGQNLRKFIIPDKGFVFVSADYRHLELRVFAHLFSAGKLIKLFRSNSDPFESLAIEVFGCAGEVNRSRIKTFLYSLLYGRSSQSLQTELERWNIKDMKVISRIKRSLGFKKTIINEFADSSIKNGYFKTLGGVKKYLQGSVAAHRLWNNYIQGSAADIFKKSFIEADFFLRTLNEKAFPILPLHDELLAQIPEKVTLDLNKLSGILSGVYNLSVPLPVKIKAGECWGKMKEQIYVS